MAFGRAGHRGDDRELQHALAASSAAIGVLALALLVVVMRRSSDPTLDLRVFRRPGALLVFTAALVASMPNLFFYTNLLIQYRATRCL